MTVLLNGVVTGTTVTINDKTVEQWDGFNAPGPTGDATVTVEVTRSALRTAPEGVFFKAVDWTGFDTVKGDVANFDNRQMDLIHIWSFGDPGSRYDVPEKLLPEWRDANTARGPFASHVYECLDGFTEGVRSHTWNLTVIEPSTGRIATASGVIDVTDPNVTFAGDLQPTSPRRETSRIAPPPCRPTGASRRWARRKTRCCSDRADASCLRGARTSLSGAGSPTSAA